MHARTVEQVRTWDSRPFGGGLGGLSELAETGHTGAVVAADTWLFMLNGRVIGIFEGSMADFEASGTIYAAPHDSVPLLFAMQERDGRTRAKYFTEDTPLAEADRTLSDANFTGYVELSENVLSGDYYLVYYGGTRRSVAFIGESERMETGEDAFERAADEVGLYEVMDVSMTITEIPEPEPSESAAGADDTADTTTASADEPSAGPAPETTSDPEPADRSPEPAPDEPDGAAPEQESDPSAEAAASPGASAEPASTAAESGDTASAEEQPKSAPAAGQSTSDSAEPDPSRTQDRSGGSAAAAQTAAESPAQAGAASETDDELDRMFRAEAEWRRTRAIPALDPDQTEPTEGEPDSRGQAGEGTDQSRQSAAATAQQTAASQSEGRAQTQKREPARSRSQASGRVSKLEAAVAERDQRIETLEERLSKAESRTESLQSELESLREERSELAAELETLRDERDDLQSRVAELEAEGPGAAPSDLAPEKALAGTNLFVRYQSKGEPTLDAIDEADPAAINTNLQLEHHTQFETEGLAVSGQSYRPFLEGTGAFRFVAWLLREFPYELLDTEANSKLSALFEAIPEIDRIEFDGTVAVDPESGREREFAVVMRDRMGNPLILAAYNEGRNPVQGDQLDDLLEGAREVADVADSLAGAFYVTASFFEPAALESAESAAASGGLFSRQDKASYVKSDAGNGFHLSLVEDRSEAFHVTVPEL